MLVLLDFCTLLVTLSTGKHPDLLGADMGMYVTGMEVILAWRSY